MQIETPRLILRSLQASDGAAIARATDETWNDLSQWMRWAVERKRYTDMAHCTAYAKNCHTLFSQGKDFTFGGFIKDTNDFVLISRFALQTDNPATYEFCGYWCRGTYQSQGYMTEAVNAISRFAFDKLLAKKLQIKHAAGNIKTRAVITSLGNWPPVRRLKCFCRYQSRRLANRSLSLFPLRHDLVIDCQCL